jgi:transposase
MIEAEKRKAIFLLHEEGLSDYKLADLFRVSRSTVQDIIKQQGEMPKTVRSDKKNRLYPGFPTCNLLSNAVVIWS